MGRPSKSKNQKKQRSAARLRAEEDFGAVPHSFVFHRGRVGRNVRQLSMDLRRVMEPYTARALKVRKKNSLRDFVGVAGPLGVTHFFVFSKTPNGVNMKLFRLPGGPTLTFKVTEYSLIRDVVSALRRHRMHEQQFLHPPLLVLSNFGLPHIHLRATAAALQSALPPINVHRVNLNTIKRCLLVSYDSDTQLLHLRHYSVKVVPVGLSRGLKKLLQEKFPNMNRMEDISELLLQDVKLSESEAEPDGTHNILQLPHSCAGRGNMKEQQSAVRLTEIGPRLTLQLVKVEEGLAQGEVLYHSFVQKSEAELRELLERREAKLRLKEERRRLQEEAVQQKRRRREEQRQRSLAGMRKRRCGADGDPEAEDPGGSENAEAESELSDAEIYRREVGREPEPDLFPKRTRSPPGSAPLRKRRRRDPHEGHRTPNVPHRDQGKKSGTPKKRGTPNLRPMGQRKKGGTPNVPHRAQGKKSGTPKKRGTPNPHSMGQGEKSGTPRQNGTPNRSPMASGTPNVPHRVGGKKRGTPNVPHRVGGKKRGTPNVPHRVGGRAGRVLGGSAVGLGKGRRIFMRHRKKGGS
uniref:Peter pan homolog n=1 Tax=Gallus gallus TaxID=9031 RepID=A0A8V0XH08_CHICK